MNIRRYIPLATGLFIAYVKQSKLPQINKANYSKITNLTITKKQNHLRNLLAFRIFASK